MRGAGVGTCCGQTPDGGPWGQNLPGEQDARREPGLQHRKRRGERAGRRPRTVLWALAVSRVERRGTDKGKREGRKLVMMRRPRVHGEEGALQGEPGSGKQEQRLKKSHAVPWLMSSSLQLS